jgi:hypothetical protein
VLAIVIVVVGREERASERRHNLDGIALVRSLVGKRIAAADNYRVSPDLYCLLYSARRRVFALELCSDRFGRIVEAVDRRGTLPTFYSITAEPEIANERIDLRLVSRLIAKLSAPKPKR